MNLKSVLFYTIYIIYFIILNHIALYTIILYIALYYEINLHYIVYSQILYYIKLSTMLYLILCIKHSMLYAICYVSKIIYHILTHAKYYMLY